MTTLLTPYLPRPAIEWDLDAPGSRWRQLDATCCFVDISGFTALSERLARRGRIGAEELTEVLNHVFSRMLAVAYEKGGSLLKFGGDALLIAFTAGDHAVEASRAAVGMRAALREARSMRTSVGRLNLRMSVGLHSGAFDLFAVGESHRELLIAGPAATVTTHMEQTADAGEIIVSADTAARLPHNAVGTAKADGFLLRWRAPIAGGPGSVTIGDVLPDVVEHGVPVALREHLRRHVDAEHRVASVGFVKFKGLDAFLAREGGSATADALHDIVRTVQRAVDDEQITFLASDIDADGGKIIMVSGVPVAREDDEGRMLRAARTIVDTALPLSIQIGVNRGHVFAGEIGTEFRRTYTVMGDTVNLAARLMAAASPGSVYATAEVLDLSGTVFSASALEPLRVKGKSQPVRAFAVGEARGPRSRRTSSLPFVGRASELSALETARDARAPAVVLIEGDRGTGKTRLVDEFVGDATNVLRVQGEAYATAVPYFAWRAPLRALLGIDHGDAGKAASLVVDALASVAPETVPLASLLAPLLDIEIEPAIESIAIAPEFRRERLADVVVQLLASEIGPQVIVIDDTQWLDEASASIAERITSERERASWIVLVARRAEGGGFRPSVTDLKIVLSPIDDDAARAVIDLVTASAPLRPQDRDQLVARAAGNPLFLEELLRVAHAGSFDVLPDTLDAVAMHEIDALGPATRRVLRHASVLGRSFDVALLVELVGADALDDVVLSELASCIVVDGDRAVFRHALLQEAAYESLPFRTRAGLHRRAGDAILCTPSSDTSATSALLSFHFFRAQDWERTWDHARTAGRLAAAAYAPDEAATHLERAVAAARRLATIAPADLADVLVDLGEALVTIGIYGDADDAYRRAAAVLRDDAIGRARIAERRSYLQGEHQGRLTSAIRHAHAGLGLLETNPPTNKTIADSVRVQLLAREAEMRFRQGRLEIAARLCGEVMIDAGQLGEMRALATAMSVLDACLYELGRPEPTPHTTKALELYERLGDKLGVAAALGNLGTMSFIESRWADAAEYYVRAAHAATQAGDLARAAVSQANLGELRINQGRVAEAESVLVPAWRTLQSNGYRINIATAAQQLGRARAFLGRHDEGLALLADAIEMYDDIGALAGSVEARARVAEVSLFAGAVDAAADALQAARDLAEPLFDTPLHVLLDRVDATLQTANGAHFDRDELQHAIARARRLGARYDLLLLLTLAADAEGERADIARSLGIVELLPLAMAST